MATVVVGGLLDATSPARRDTDHVGIDLDLRPGETAMPLEAAFEHALVVLEGELRLGDRVLQPGHLGYLGTGRPELRLRTSVATRALLIGGLPLPEPVLMWWNYVARHRDEITAAHRHWTTGSVRFGHVKSLLPRLDVGPPPWTT